MSYYPIRTSYYCLAPPHPAETRSAGNGIENGADAGMADVGVSFLDEGGDTWPGLTDANGHFVIPVGVGEGTLSVSGAAGAALATGNNIQDLTISEGLETIASAVGYPPPSEDATFVNVALAGGIGVDHSTDGTCAGPPVGIGAAWADVDGDGDQDLFTTNRTGENHLYRSDGDTDFDVITEFTDIAASCGIDAAAEDSFGTVFIDYNNDGWQDLFFAQGSIGTPAALAKALLENDGDGTFTDVIDITGMGDEARARNVSRADFSGDGWVDVFVGDYDDYPMLMQNNAATNGNVNEWLTITVEGTESNRDGIESLVSVTTPAGTQAHRCS